MSYFPKRYSRGTLQRSSLAGILDSYGTSGGTQAPPTTQQQPSSYGQPATTPPPDPTKPKEAGIGSELAKLFGALALNKLATPTTSPYYPQPQAAPGISSTTLLIGGAIGVTALVLLLK